MRLEILFSCACAAILTFTIFILLPQLTKSPEQSPPLFNAGKINFEINDLTEQPEHFPAIKSIKYPKKENSIQKEKDAEIIEIPIIEKIIANAEIEKKSEPDSITIIKKENKQANIIKTNEQQKQSEAAVETQKTQTNQNIINFNSRNIYDENEVDIAPSVIRRVTPDYPYIARELNKTGIVKLAFTVNSNGAVEDIKILNETEPGLFSANAVNALKKWKFAPGMINSIKVATRVTIDFKFNLE